VLSFFEEIESGNVVGCLAAVVVVFAGAVAVLAGAGADVGAEVDGGQGLVRSVAKTEPLLFAAP
jgi:hypothetical protein